MKRIKNNINSIISESLMKVLLEDEMGEAKKRQLDSTTSRRLKIIFEDIEDAVLNGDRAALKRAFVLLDAMV